MPETLKQYRCGITPWRGVDAVFVAEGGWTPGTTYHEFHLLNVSPRNCWAKDPLGALAMFVEDVGLPFGDEIEHYLHRFPGSWTLYRFEPEMGGIGDDCWTEVASY
jgi:hypothetical protein